MEETPQVNPIDKANEFLEKIKVENERSEKILKQREELLAKEMVSGRSYAGIQTKQVDPETQRMGELKEIFKGTVINLK